MCFSSQAHALNPPLLSPRARVNYYRVQALENLLNFSTNVVRTKKNKFLLTNRPKQFDFHDPKLNPGIVAKPTEKPTIVTIPFESNIAFFNRNATHE